MFLSRQWARNPRETSMNRKHDRVSHLVRVARIRIETTVVEIKGDDCNDEDVERQAVEAAELLPDDIWVRQPFDENAYRPHVQSIISPLPSDQVLFSVKRRPDPKA